MMSFTKKLVGVFFILLHSFSAQATHIVGGEITYKYLGGDSYLITLTVMRDCFNSGTPFDPLASIGVFDSGNNLLFSIQVAPQDSSPILNTGNSPCLIPPNNICYRVAHYTATISLPVLAGGYQLAYQRCCRNHTVVNVANVAATGATYFTKVPDRNVVPINSSPEFQNLPSTFICRNFPFIYDHSAVDLEGDSLVYDLCTPYNGGSQALPNPQPPANPPYSLITWQSPYSLVNVMGGTPLQINPLTGLLTATPSNIGQFVYGVRVREFRNGNYVGETRREFQVNVVNCPKIVNSVVQLPDYQCGNNTVVFNNTSTGASAYTWNFGDTTTLADTSHLRNPVYTYPSDGVYSIMLVAYSSVNPNCNDTSYSQVELYPKFEAKFNYVLKSCNDTLAFQDITVPNSGPVVKWNWNFGDGATSVDSSVTHVFGNGGTYVVKLVATSQLGCADTVVQDISVPYIPEADFNTVVDSCRPEVSLLNKSRNAFKYLWRPGDDIGLQFYSRDLNYIYKNEGEYTVTLLVESESQCFDSVSKKINYQQAEFLGHYLPNAFTPNGDGKNDDFYISGATPCEEVEFLVYNRWGDLIFQTSDLSVPWNGRYKGEFVPPGVYVYYLVGTNYKRSGLITVVK